jgi:TM2 domain-containing membrane protein YozV
MTGIPFSDKQKVVAGLLQLLIPIGIGRFYLGHTGLGVAQLLVTFITCGLGTLWPVIDGIMILMGNVPDVHGRPLRD